MPEGLVNKREGTSEKERDDLQKARELLVPLGRNYRPMPAVVLLKLLPVMVSKCSLKKKKKY